MSANATRPTKETYRQQLRDAVAENGTLKSRVAELENGIRESLALPHGEEELAILVDLLIPKP